MLYRKQGLSPEMNKALDEFQEERIKVWQLMLEDPLIPTPRKEWIKQRLAETTCWRQAS